MSRNFAEYVQAKLEAVQPLRAELKRRAMIYQCEEKEYAAERMGKPFDAFHELPYEEWAAIRSVWGFNGKGE